METLAEAIDRLRRAGYHLDLIPVPGGLLRCGGCGAVVAARDARVVETVRFEGESNPDDQAILTAISSPCGHLGIFCATYGAMTPPDEAAVLRAFA